MSGKQDFNFFVDRRVAIWTRNCYTISADSLEEAQQIVKDKVEYLTGYYEEDGIEWIEDDWLVDSEEQLDWGQLSEEPTFELYWIGEDEVGDTHLSQKIWDNTPLHVLRDKKIGQIIDK